MKIEYNSVIQTNGDDHGDHTHLLLLVRAPPERREDAVRPVVGGDVEPAEHLRGGDRLRVHPHLLVRLPAVRQRLHHHVDALGLAGAARAERHHAVPDVLRLVQLDQLQRPRRVVDQPHLGHLAAAQRTTRSAANRRARRESVLKMYYALE